VGKNDPLEFHYRFYMWKKRSDKKASQVGVGNSRLILIFSSTNPGS
jgi:hypothetical protein